MHVQGQVLLFLWEPNFPIRTVKSKINYIMETKNPFLQGLGLEVKG